MTFTTRIKEEITNIETNPIEAMSELAAFIRFDGIFKDKTIILTIENASVARRIYKLIKMVYGINIRITVRNQKRFKIKQLYILEIKERYKHILETLSIEENDKKVLPNEYLLESEEEKRAFIRGIFLSCGSINDPSGGTYHLEFVVKTKREAEYIKRLLNEYDADAKVLKREKRYMIYIKSAEIISEFIRLFGASNSLFYFEDIRIYRDHKNMVNRLNNCEIANQEKIINTGLKQMNDITYLEDNDLIDLLDTKTKDVIDYRRKYPETSYQELADIISMETEKSISKSGINHAFIKIRELVRKHKENRQ